MTKDVYLRFLFSVLVALVVCAVVILYAPTGTQYTGASESQTTTYGGYGYAE